MRGMPATLLGMLDTLRMRSFMSQTFEQNKHLSEFGKASWHNLCSSFCPNSLQFEGWQTTNDNSATANEMHISAVPTTNLSCGKSEVDISFGLCMMKVLTMPDMQYLMDVEYYNVV